jgi:hypothetical protein
MQVVFPPPPHAQSVVTVAQTALPSPWSQHQGAQNGQPVEPVQAGGGPWSGWG